MFKHHHDFLYQCLFIRKAQKYLNEHLRTTTEDFKVWEKSCSLLHIFFKGSVVYLDMQSEKPKNQNPTNQKTTTTKK